MKPAVLISIQPQHCENICKVIDQSAGKPIYKKRIEVRKTRPKIDTPFKCYIYCTQDKYLHLYDLREVSHGEFNFSVVQHNKTSLVASGYLNGKVIGEFICDSIEEIQCNNGIQAYYNNREETCLSDFELRLYATVGKPLYFWHISELKIYNKPKELSEFKAYRWECETVEKQFKFCRFGYAHKTHCEFCKWIRSAPQSWRYVEV